MPEYILIKHTDGSAAVYKRSAIRDAASFGTELGEFDDSRDAYAERDRLGLIGPVIRQSPPQADAQRHTWQRVNLANDAIQERE